MISTLVLLFRKRESPRGEVQRVNLGNTLTSNKLLIVKSVGDEANGVLAGAAVGNWLILFFIDCFTTKARLTWSVLIGLSLAAISASYLFDLSTHITQSSQQLPNFIAILIECILRVIVFFWMLRMFLLSASLGFDVPFRWGYFMVTAEPTPHPGDYSVTLVRRSEQRKESLKHSEIYTDPDVLHKVTQWIQVRRESHSEKKIEWPFKLSRQFRSPPRLHKREETVEIRPDISAAAEKTFNNSDESIGKMILAGLSAAIPIFAGGTMGMPVPEVVLVQSLVDHPLDLESALDLQNEDIYESKQITKADLQMGHLSNEGICESKRITKTELQLDHLSTEEIRQLIQALDNVISDEATLETLNVDNGLSFVLRNARISTVLRTLGTLGLAIGYYTQYLDEESEEMDAQFRKKNDGSRGGDPLSDIANSKLVSARVTLEFDSIGVQISVTAFGPLRLPDVVDMLHTELRKYSVQLVTLPEN
ncbi:MAG: hypothetical protein V3V18_08595 [Methylococcales bacterium]